MKTYTVGFLFIFALIFTSLLALSSGPPITTELGFWLFKLASTAGVAWVLWSLAKEEKK